MSSLSLLHLCSVSFYDVQHASAFAKSHHQCCTVFSKTLERCVVIDCTSSPTLLICITQWDVTYKDHTILLVSDIESCLDPHSYFLSTLLSDIPNLCLIIQ